jgi:hypothetical protein
MYAQGQTAPMHTLQQDAFDGMKSSYAATMTNMVAEWKTQIEKELKDAEPEEPCEPANAEAGSKGIVKMSRPFIGSSDWIRSKVRQFNFSIFPLFKNSACGLYQFKYFLIT